MNQKIKTVAITFFVLVSTTFTAQSEPSSPLATKQEDIRLLLEITGTKEMAMQMATHMISSFKESMPDVPDAMWTMLIAEMDPDELVELCIPAYENNFTHNEIKQLLEFNQSQIGKTLIAKQPLVLKECMKAGEVWGQRLSERVTANIKKYYGEVDAPREQLLSEDAKAQAGTDYYDILFSMVSKPKGEKKYQAYAAGHIDPSVSMCGLTFGMSMDEVIAVWGLPSGINMDTTIPPFDQELHYGGSRVSFKNNGLYEVSLHRVDFPDAVILDGIVFGMSPDQVTEACSKLKSETRGSRIYYKVTDGITMKPHFYSKKSEPTKKLITVKFSIEEAKPKTKKESSQIGLDSIIGEHKIIAFDYTKKEGMKSKIVAHESEGSTLLITKDQIIATNFRGKKIMHIGNSPTVDTASEEDFIIGNFNGDENAEFYIQPEEMDLNGTIRTATCFSCDLSDGSYIILWIE